jgi:hypothetical protein
VANGLCSGFEKSTAVASEQGARKVLYQKVSAIPPLLLPAAQAYPDCRGIPTWVDELWANIPGRLRHEEKAGEGGYGDQGRLIALSSRSFSQVDIRIASFSVLIGYLSRSVPFIVSLLGSLLS